MMKSVTLISQGRAARLLLALVAVLLLAGPARAQSVTVTGPTGSGAFGTRVVGLPSGNYVVTDPGFDSGGLTDVGAVYLYRGSDNTVISTLTGSRANDQVGSGEVFVLTNGNFVVASPNWSSATAAVGAATWGSGTAGVSGPVSAANSLVGSRANDQVSLSGVYALSNGNYVVSSQNWSTASAAKVGAATWASGTGGTVGAVSASNSLVGSTANDRLGLGGLVALTGNGNYLVGSPDWDNGSAADAGAATWASGTGGTVGPVSAANSLVGSTANDRVGEFNTIKPLTNGNYVVGSRAWANGSATGAGAATWGSGTAGVSGVISVGNSLLGSQINDFVGDVVTALSNGNYVVGSGSWSNGATRRVGAATWADGSTGLVGTVNTANSLVGTQAFDGVGSRITALASNGNYVVGSPDWSNGGTTSAGAATWANGSTGLVGTVNTANSLVGTQANDQVSGGFYGGIITALTNGNYVVTSPAWANVGAATWANGSTGLVGTVSTGNSLTGTQANDRVGSRLTALTNGNYVVGSSGWANGGNTSAGAVTWGNGASGTTGRVNTANSLVGSRANDQVADYGMVPLTNGNYIVRSSQWANGAATAAGAVTWGSGTGGTVGAVSASNSLVGSRTDDQVGLGGIGRFALPSGAYSFGSSSWDNGTIVDAGAVTLGSAAGTTTGPLTNCNSVLGTVANGGNRLVINYNPVTDKLLVGLPAENRVAIGVDSPPTPTGAAVQYLPATATVASLAATGTAIKWYTTATGGSALAPATALTDGATYYATQTFNGCESIVRLAVTAYLAPVISSLSPTSGPEGTPVTITGLRFYGVTGLTLNGTTLTYTVVNATTVTLTVPAGATSGNVVITTAAGASNGVAFGVSPAITGLSPGSGAMGSTFTLTGTSLGSTTSVQLGGQRALFTINSATQLTVTVPAGASSYRVQVTTPGGTALSAAAFGVDKFDSYNFPLVTTNFNAIRTNNDAAPTFTDLDANGRLNLLIGNSFGQVVHYEQNSVNSRSFSQATSLNNIAVTNGAAPTVTDLDGNGRLDLLVGNRDGNLAHYQQNSANSPGFTLVTATFNGINVGLYATPTFTDLDGDGRLDLVVGSRAGNLVHYEQDAPNSGSFTLVTSNFNNINTGTFPTPTFNDLNGDGRLDLLIGRSDGNVAHYQQASANSLSFTLVTNFFNGIDVGDYSSPILTDLDGNGRLDLLVGGTTGQLTHYEQQLPVPVITALNPTSGAVGASVTITGTGLGGATGVSFNGGPQNTITSNTNTSLTVAVPAGAVTGPVTVTTGGGSASSQPATVLRLQATGGTGGDKTVYLDQVELLQGGSVVSGGVANGSFETGAPAGTLTNNPTTVSGWTFASNGGQAAISTTGSAFAPPAPSDGTAHLAVLQGGSPYLEQALNLPGGTYQVRFRLAQRQCCTTPYDQAVQVLINGVAVGAALTTTSAGYVQLTSDAFTVTNAGVFTVIPTPTVVSFSPASGAVGSTISLTGTNLTGTTAITFAGSGANVVTTGFTVVSATSITGVVVPEGAITGPLTVTTGVGTSVASAASFTVCGVIAKGQNASQALGAGGTATFDASAFDNASYSSCGGTLQPTLRKGGLAFNRANEGGSVVLTAPAGYTFTAVDFASYGNPAGSNVTGDYTFGSCHAASSRSVVEAAVLGQTGTVTIPVSNAVFGGDPCGGTPKRLAVRAFYTRTPAAGDVVFGSAAENTSLTLTAPAGTVFAGVSYANYGTTTGTGGNYVAGTCQSANSRSVVEAALLGKSGTVSIPVNNATFGGDPCGGTPKTLAVRATYVPGGPSLAFDCTELGAQLVLLTFTDAAGARATAVVTATVSVPAQPTTAWTGSRSTDWTDCTNWSYGLVPTASISAMLPAGMPRYPSLPAGTYLVKDLTIASGASLTTTSGATLQVLGDWTNNSPSVTVGGDVVFSGPTAQAIGGTVGTAFATVVVSKAAGTLTLGRDLAIGTRLSLTSGTLATTDSYRVLLGPTATLAETETAYVTGAVEATRALSTAGTGSSFGGLGLTLTPGGATLPGSTTVRRTTGTPATGVSNRVGIGRYFDIQPTVNTGLNVSMVFSYFEHELNNIPEANLRLFKSTSTAVGPWMLQAPITADATANTVTRTGITDFSLWTLGNSAAPLPVELLTFTATATADGPTAVRLAWATATEKNSRAFEVERGLDGATYTKVGTVAAAGSSSAPRAYALLDAQLPVGTALLYYRLRQVDADGTFSYSPVRTVALPGAAAGLSLFPNPTGHGPATHAATLTGARPGAVVTVLDALGRLVLAATADAAGTAALRLPAGLPTGVYVVRAGSKALRLTVE